MGQFLEQVWLPSKQGRVEVSTYDQYEWAVRRHIVPLLGALRLRDFTAEVADEWVTALTAPNSWGKPRLGATSARQVRKILSMAMEEAVQRGSATRPPTLALPPVPLLIADPAVRPEIYAGARSDLASASRRARGSTDRRDIGGQPWLRIVNDVGVTTGRLLRLDVTCDTETAWIEVSVTLDDEFIGTMGRGYSLADPEALAGGDGRLPP